MLHHQQLAATIVCAVWSLTVGGVSNPWPLTEPSCLGTGINPETGTEMGGPAGSVYPSVTDAVVGT